MNTGKYSLPYYFRPFRSYDQWSDFKLGEFFSLFFYCFLIVTQPCLGEFKTRRNSFKVYSVKITRGEKYTAVYSSNLITDKHHNPVEIE